MRPPTKEEVTAAADSLGVPLEAEQPRHRSQVTYSPVDIAVAVELFRVNADVDYILDELLPFGDGLKSLDDILESRDVVLRLRPDVLTRYVELALVRYGAEAKKRNQGVSP